MKKNPAVLSYILITAARNEEKLIAGTIQSVISQTVLPTRWIIVNDGSNDHTEMIVSRYVALFSWIELLSMPEHKDRNFAAKVHCFNFGFQRIKGQKYDIIGNLDADITFGSEYFEFLLRKFEANPKLGVAGTPFIEGTQHYNYRFASTAHVSGGCQLFRRECFEQVGGYIPIKEGGIDWLAVTTARMKGWTTRTFLEKTYIHHRKIGTGAGGRLAAMYNYGLKNYLFGAHPLWQFLRACYQTKEEPIILGGILLIVGYAYGYITRMKRPISPELMQFYRREQISRLKSIVLRYLA